MNIVVEYLLFIGSGLYLVSTILFFRLWLKTLKFKDGAGLTFLKILTLSLSLGSFVIFVIRFWSEYGGLDFLVARALAVTNPILLVFVALYLNYLFRNHKQK